VTKISRNNTDTVKASNSRGRGRPTATFTSSTSTRMSVSANDNTVLTCEDSDSEDEFVSIKDMHQRCVSLQLLPETSVEETVTLDQHSMDYSGTSGGSSSADLTALVNTSATTHYTTVIVNPLYHSSKKYSLDFLQSLTDDIRTCIEKNTTLGFVSIPSTRFISNNDHLVYKLRLLVSDLENAVDQANVWVEQYNRLFQQADGDLVSTATSSSSNNNEMNASKNLMTRVDLTVAQELVSTAPKNVKIEQVAQLEAQIRTLLKVKRILDPCVNTKPVVRSDSSTQLLPIKTEHSSSSTKCSGATTGATDVPVINAATASLRWDDLLNITRLVLSALPLSLGDTYVLEILKRYETYSQWVRQTLSPVVAGSSGTKSRRSVAVNSVAAQSNANGKNGANVSNNHSSGLDTSTTEFEEYALLLRLVDTFCLQECIRIESLPSAAATTTVAALTPIPVMYAESEAGVETGMQMGIFDLLPHTESPAQIVCGDVDSHTLPITVVDTESESFALVPSESDASLNYCFKEAKRQTQTINSYDNFAFAHPLPTVANGHVCRSSILRQSVVRVYGKTADRKCPAARHDSTHRA